MPDHNCPPESDLQALATGVLDEARVQALEAHLLGCDVCAQHTVELAANDTLIMAIRKTRSQPGLATIDEPHLKQLMQAFEELHPEFSSSADATAPSAPGSESIPTAANGEPPKVLGNYDLLQLIGAGGMGQVFKARHRRMNRVVALKVLHADSMRDPVVIARFEREVKAVSAISHPNIVAAYDADQEGDVHFLVMEYVEGSDLSVLVKQSGPFSVERAIQCVLQAARGLQAAHAQGIVHRDIKPANLLLDNNGTIKILDMGLARFHGDVPAQAELTALGMVMGTVDYMAPEQALDTKTADGRADIYSLGCTLYYLLTGEATYRGDTLTSRLLAHQSQPIPDLRASRPDISESLVAVFEKMVAKRVSERYRSMAEVIADLEHLPSTTLLRRRQSDVARSDSDTAVLGTSRLTSSPTTSFVRRGSTGKGWRLRRRLLTCGTIAALVLTAVIIILKGKDGTNLEITVNWPDAVITVFNEQGALEVKRDFKTDPIRISLKPGKKRIQIEKDGFVTHVDDSVEIKDGENHLPISVKLVRDDPHAIAQQQPVKPTLQQPPVTPAVPAIPQRKLLPPGALDQWVQEVRALPAEEQVVAFAKKMQELNPGFELKIPPRIASSTVKELDISLQQITDISPVRAFSGLEWLSLQNCPVSDLTALQELPLKGLNIAGTRVADLTALQRMPLTNLNFCFAPVIDLSPISKLPLTELHFSNTFIQDLAPLRGMSLKHLGATFTMISNLRPLEGMPLKMILMSGTQVADLSPLRGMSLDTVHCSYTLVSDLSPLQGMPLTSFECGTTRVADLTPLNGLPLLYMDIGMTPVSDLSPLKGMPLRRLSIGETDVRNLMPLAGAPIEDFDCAGTLVTDLTPLQQMPLLKLRFTPGPVTNGLDELRNHKTLEAIATRIGPLLPTVDFWKKHAAGEFPTVKPLTRLDDPEFIKWTTEVSALPAERQLEAVARKLKELNPKFDGKFVSHAIEFETVTRIHLSSEQIVDISPVRAFKGLDELHLKGRGIISRETNVFEDLSPLQGLALKALLIEGAMVSDLTPLKGMPLTQLACSHTRVADLSPLRGMKLEWLDCNRSHVSDLSPLEDAPLKELKCGDTGVSDLSPMKGKPLRLLVCNRTQVSDLSPLKGMPLSSLMGDLTQISDLSPLEGMKLEWLELAHTPVRDLTPLKGMPLRTIRLTGCRITNLSPLQGMDLTHCYLTPRYLLRGVEVLGPMSNVTIIATEGREGIDYAPAVFLKEYAAGALKIPTPQP